MNHSQTFKWPEARWALDTLGLVDWFSVGVLVVTAVVAGFGAGRVAALNRLAREPVLGRLRGAYLGFGAALGLEALGALLFLVQDPAFLRERFDHHDVLFWARHLAWFVALGLALTSFDRRRHIPGRHEHGAPAIAAWLLVSHPVLLVIEAVALVYLVLRGAWNHLRRSNIGSLEVSLGFAALAASRLLPFLVDPDGPAPLGAPHLATTLLALTGVVLLWMVVPTRRGGGAGA